MRQEISALCKFTKILEKISITYKLNHPVSMIIEQSKFGGGYTKFLCHESSLVRIMMMQVGKRDRVRPAITQSTNLCIMFLNYMNGGSNGMHWLIL